MVIPLTVNEVAICTLALSRIKEIAEAMAVNPNEPENQRFDRLLPIIKGNELHIDPEAFKGTENCFAPAQEIINQIENIGLDYQEQDCHKFRDKLINQYNFPKPW